MFFSRPFFRDLVRLGKERKKNVPFFLKERKRTERTERSFEKNGKEWKRTERTERSFEKNGCPTLVFSISISFHFLFFPFYYPVTNLFFVLRF